MTLVAPAGIGVVLADEEEEDDSPLDEVVEGVSPLELVVVELAVEVLDDDSSLDDSLDGLLPTSPML